MRLRALAAASIAVSMLVAAGSHAAGDNAVRGPAEAASPETGRAVTAGVVKKVNKDAGKVTISHEPIERMGMPKMTMIFRVKDPAMLDRMKEGDKIRFVADKVDGAFTVMEFEPAE